MNIMNNLLWLLLFFMLINPFIFLMISSVQIIRYFLGRTENIPLLMFFQSIFLLSYLITLSMIIIWEGSYILAFLIIGTTLSILPLFVIAVVAGIFFWKRLNYVEKISQVINIATTMLIFILIAIFEFELHNL